MKELEKYYNETHLIDGAPPFKELSNKCKRGYKETIGFRMWAAAEAVRCFGNTLRDVILKDKQKMSDYAKSKYHK